MAWTKKKAASDLPEPPLMVTAGLKPGDRWMMHANLHDIPHRGVAVALSSVVCANGHDQPFGLRARGRCRRCDRAVSTMEGRWVRAPIQRDIATGPPRVAG